MENNKLKIVSALVLVNIFFGTGYPLVKLVVQYLPPAQWAFLRMGLYTLLLLILIFKKFLKEKPPLRKIKLLLLGSLLGLVINQICFIEGLARTMPSHASMINATIPLQTLFYSRLFLKESIAPLKFFAVFLGFLGIGILLRFDQIDHSNPYLIGDLLSFTNSASYALFLTFSGKILKDINPFLALLWMSFMASFAMGFYADWHIPFDEIFNFPKTILFAMIYLALFQSLFTYSLNLWALKQAPPTLAALFVYLQPLVATILSFFLMGDIPDSRFYISGCLILAAIILGLVRK